MAAIDTAAMRLRFPARLRIGLRSGSVIEIEGRERGACGAALDEQREVVAEKARVVGLEEPAPV